MTRGSVGWKSAALRACQRTINTAIAAQSKDTIETPRPLHLSTPLLAQRMPLPSTTERCHPLFLRARTAVAHLARLPQLAARDATLAQPWPRSSARRGGLLIHSRQQRPRSGHREHPAGRGKRRAVSTSSPSLHGIVRGCCPARLVPSTHQAQSEAPARNAKKRSRHTPRPALARARRSAVSAIPQRARARPQFPARARVTG